MAGAITSGPGKARAWQESMSSASPWASLARVLAVAGATTNPSASWPGSKWPNTAESFSNMSAYTGAAPSASKDRGVTNLCAPAVNVALTWTPVFCSKRNSSRDLNADTLPLTPRWMRLPR